MERTLKQLFFFTVLLSLGITSGAQIRTAHYEIIVPEGTSDVYSSEMEQRFTEFNKVFRFDPAQLGSLLKVRVFTDKNEYDSYVVGLLGSPRPGAIYIHYRNPANRELVIHRGSSEEDSIVPYQAFIQFLRAFIHEPPPWLREGFAVYFNTLKYDRARGTLVYEENLSWLDTAKRSAINPEAILQSAASFPNIQAFSWAMVSFFMSDKSSDYFRSLTDSLMMLSPDASTEENVQLMYKRLIMFNPIAALTRDYSNYIAGKKTFTELVEDGQRAYGAKNYIAAEESFRKAATLRNNHYAPWYYLGLVAYENKKYNEAEDFYKKALDLGGERALIQYARGVNAAAAGKKAEAIAFLEEAAAADSARYKTRSDELIRKLQ
ncbi:MAG: tetratricopeptide repeat protein [Treponema sp.]|nr:tetratricopeptide repeat protein [Treponema sp.]